MWHLLTSLKGEAATCLDFEVEAGAVYQYRVRAVNDFGASAWSNEAEVEVTESTGGILTRFREGLSPDAIIQQVELVMTVVGNGADPMEIDVFALVPAGNFKGQRKF